MIWGDNLWNELNKMHKRLNTLFGDSWDDFYEEEKINKPLIGYRKAFTNFKETDKEFIIEVEIPGVEKEDIELNLTNKRIEIKAEKKKEKKQINKEKKAYFYEKTYAGFYKKFDVPDNADVSRINASYKNGVLTIKLPKKISSKNKKTIQIK